MIWIIAYLLVVAVGDIMLLVMTFTDAMPAWWLTFRLVVTCALVGGIGGVTYCLRGVYLNKCVYKRWDAEWTTWYYTRPVVSHICGAVSYVFLKAGMLLLEAKQAGPASDFGFYALAFIAGLNVDKFVSKIEDIAQAVWGIEKSRTAKEEKKDGN